MDVLTRAFSQTQRSLLAAKASLSSFSGADLLARGQSGGVQRTTDLNRAGNQLAAFRGWVFACVRAIASKIAGQQVHVSRGNKELDDHAILSLLSDPNELMVSWSMMFSSVASVQLTGRSLWWTPTVDDRKQAFPIPSSWIVGIEGTTAFTKFYIRPKGHIGDPIGLPSQECVYFSLPHPGDPHGSCSPLAAASMAVETDGAIEASQANSFRFTCKHALVVGRNDKTGLRPTLSGPQRRQIIRSLREAYGGLMNEGDPLILDSLIEDIKELKPNEFDWLSSGKVTKERICQIFGVNPVILGQLEGANRASALAAEIHFAVHTCNPLIRLFSETLTGWLAPQFGDGLTVWIDEVVPNDSETEFRKWDLACKYSAVTGHELRTYLGLPLGSTMFSGPVGLSRGGTPIDDGIRQVANTLISEHIASAMQLVRGDGEP